MLAPQPGNDNIFHCGCANKNCPYYCHISINIPTQTIIKYALSRAIQESSYPVILGRQSQNYTYITDSFGDIILQTHFIPVPLQDFGSHLLTLANKLLKLKAFT
jgi:hypothetical protein